MERLEEDYVERKEGRNAEARIDNEMQGRGRKGKEDRHDWMIRKRPGICSSMVNTTLFLY